MLIGVLIYTRFFWCLQSDVSTDSRLQGDAVLFHSESLHNVLTVTTGIRQSLVLELWTEHKNSADRAA